LTLVYCCDFIESQEQTPVEGKDEVISFSDQPKT